MSGALLLAWLLPFASGVAAYCAVDARAAPGRSAALAGYGIVFGLLLASVASALRARANTAHALSAAAPALLLFALLAGSAAWWRIRRRDAVAPVPHAKLEKWKTVLIIAALLSLAWRGWLALREVLLRPTYPWDAWDAWAVKSKTWFLLGHYAPFVSARDWLAQHPPDAYTGPAWSYPSALAWMQVWFASAAGDWIEPLVNLPWIALWAGLLLAHYGQWRALGLSRPQAVGFVYLLGSLPLLAVHAALAGYADLWVATLLGLALLAWLRWIEQRDRGQLLIAALCACALPLLKLEGTIWLLLLAAVAGYGALPRRRRKMVAAVIVLVLVAMALIGKLLLPLYGLGWVSVGTQSIDVPVLGRLPIGWHPGAVGGLFSSLFAQSNWHLLWWLTPVLVVWRWRALRAREATRLLALFLCAGFGFLAFLFLGTDAARWAESFTAFNRLLMHVVPATVTLCALLYCAPHPARRGRASAYAPLHAQA